MDKNVENTKWIENDIADNTVLNRDMLFKMKKIQIVCVVMISLLLIGISENNFVQARESQVRGMWVSFLDYEAAGLVNQSETQFRVNADKMFEKIASYGMNHVYFQVRAFDDAIYPSEEYAFSTYMATTKPAYDPLAILIQSAHNHGLKFHAWINPYRITYDKIYNPAKQKTINHIVAGVEEIIENYNVDGIQFDDYFYPSVEKGKPYYKVSISKRKENVNKMIRKVYQTIKAHNKKIQFGISPAGNVSYAESIGCDLATWLSQDGYIDYILPQIYWSNQYLLDGKKCKYYTRQLTEWNRLNQNNTKMYIGLALYRAGMDDEVDLGWSKKTNIITSQVKELVKAGNPGFVLFSYRFLDNSSASKKEMKNYVKFTFTAGKKNKAVRVIVRPKKVTNVTSKIKTVQSSKKQKGKISKKKVKTCVIRWKAVPKVDGYVIYRSKKKNGTYKKVATVKENQYVLKYRKKSKRKKEYYKVKAYRKQGSEKYYGKLSDAIGVKR